MPQQYYQLAALIVAGLIFHAILWARNGRFLWSQRKVIAWVVAAGVVWQLVTDPIGAWWGAWTIDPSKTIGIWLFAYTPIENLLGTAVVASAAACAVLVFGYSPRRWV